MATLPYHLQGAKEALISLLKEKGISKNVLDAFTKVHRHEFLEPYLDYRAYEDIALPTFCNQTISQPSTVAFQTQLLDVKPGQKILEIGTGSGFQAAILSAMNARVYTVERFQELYMKTTKLLEKVDYRIITHYGDGFLGWSKYAPYDRILVTCGAPEVPDTLLAQLKPGGYMVIPVGEENQKMLRVMKLEDESLQIEEFGDCRFVPMLKDRVAK